MEWRQKMTEKNENVPNSGQEAGGEARREAEGQAEPRVRAVPNIPRREPDSLPERPEKSKSSAGGVLVILLALALIVLFLVFVFRPA